MATNIYLSDGQIVSVAADPAEVNGMLYERGATGTVFFSDTGGREVWVNPAQVTRLIERHDRPGRA